jgi:hypothetical protein
MLQQHEKLDVARYFNPARTRTAGLVHPKKDTMTIVGWTAQGLLQPAATGVPAPARLSLFARAVEEFYAGPARRFPLRSAFALQRPVVFYPGLATLEIHDRRRFPWVAAIEAAFPVIHQEFLGLLGGGADFATVHRPPPISWAFGEKVDATCRAFRVPSLRSLG